MAFPITLILGCRMGDNENSSLRPCLESLVATADDTGNFEILLKLDEDDPQLAVILQLIENFSDRLNIRHIVTPRGIGYGDLHKAYLDLYRIADPESELFWVISDDIVLESDGWDTKMLSHTRDHADGLYALHTWVMVDFDHRTQRDAIEGPDPYPVWSKRWLQLQGGFGFTFSTDGWTSLLCHRLYTHYRTDRRIFVEGIKINRRTAPCDLEGSERWNGIRKNTHDLMLSPQMQTLLDGTALAMFSYAERENERRNPTPTSQLVDGTSTKKLVKIVARRIRQRLRF